MISESLAALKNNFYSSAPKDILDIIDQSIFDLVENKLVEKAIKVGKKMPEFTLKNAVGNQISLSSLLQKGPLVVNFYRGGW
ncbi:redoxin domain-containing protein [Acidaminobacter sp. JC074]|nr:redoxin domain-containing protein [Acidaminobacter sp. JC074]MCH4890183.1 redoxin domain-containing protein [Acidaminobacter sp. JC074]